MRATTILAVFLCFGATALANKEPGESPARYTVKVIDEDGKPIRGVSVMGGFYTEEPRLSGVTDSNGLFVAECKKAMSGEAGFSVCHNTPGYYETHSGYYFQKVVNGRWEPWNPTVTAVVRRVVNPIPMYSKNVETFLPATNTPFGFDLMAGDWVAPNGKGQYSDIFISVIREVLNLNDYDVKLTISFTNRHDGLCPFLPFADSKFKSPRFAPVEGYRAEYCREMGRKPGRGSFNTEPLADEKCTYRIRTLTNEEGRVTSAHYGKFTSGFRVTGYGAEKVTLLFTYYLNPTPNDRNLEFDPSRNLFTNLKSTERVTDP